MEDGGETNDSSYIPTEKEKEPHFSVMFSMKEEKAALVRALELCKVSSLLSRRCRRVVWHTLDNYSGISLIRTPLGQKKVS